MLLDDFDGDGDPSKHTFDNTFVVDDPLKSGDDHAATAGFLQLNHDEQSITWSDDTAKTDFVDTAEANHRCTQQVMALREETGQLCHRFQHHHTGH